MYIISNLIISRVFTILLHQYFIHEQFNRIYPHKAIVACVSYTPVIVGSQGVTLNTMTVEDLNRILTITADPEHEIANNECYIRNSELPVNITAITANHGSIDSLKRGLNNFYPAVKPELIDRLSKIAVEI